MGKSTPSGPTPPDPTATAAAQGAANVEAAREQARLSQFNQVTPQGSLTFTGEIGSPERTATTALTPAGQAQFEAQQQIGQGLTEFAGTQLGNIQETLGQPLSFEGLQETTPGLEGRNRAEQAIFQRGSNLLEPGLAEQERKLDVSLAQRGIPIGSPAHTEAKRQLMAQQGLQRENLGLSAITAGGQEQSRQFGVDQAARQQGLAELLQQRGQPINELSALLGQSPQVQTPGFQQFQQQAVQPANVLGAQELSLGLQSQNFQNQQAQNAASMGGLFGLGAAGIGAAPFLLASDRRVKTGIKRVGVLDNGLPVYTFRYKSGGPVQMGVMAQEVETVLPEAVHDMNGMKAVDYGML